jgi:hypothetical protein
MVKVLICSNCNWWRIYFFAILLHDMNIRHVIEVIIFTRHSDLRAGIAL